jgi:hypothetical protein
MTKECQKLSTKAISEGSPRANPFRSGFSGRQASSHRANPNFSRRAFRIEVIVDRMIKPELTRRRVALAFAAAGIADLIQVPVTAAMLSGVLTVPGETANIIIDAIVMIITSLLLGFHWILLPSVILELVPVFDLFPTWTACVAFVVWRRRQEEMPFVVPPHSGPMKTVDVDVLPADPPKAPPRPPLLPPSR